MLLDLYCKFMAYLKREEGQDLVEYALLLALIAIICILAVTLGGQAISNVWSRIVGAMGTWGVT